VSRGDPARLQRVLDKARRGEPIVLGMIGGSITQRFHASSQETCYASLVAAWWRKTFPKAEITLVNAGIGATNSDYGALRVQRDVLSKHPDLVLVEFSVNDLGIERAGEMLEGLVRQALNAPGEPAVVLFCMMVTDGSSAQDSHAKVAQYYGLPMVSYRDGLLPELRAHHLKSKDIATDTVHPNDRGHAYAAAFIDHLFEVALKDLPDDPAAFAPIKPVPNPLFSDLYEHTTLVEAKAMQPVGTPTGWTLDPGDQWHDPFWNATQPGSVMELKVSGRAICVMYWRIHGDMGQVRVTVDDGAPQVLEGWYEQTWGGYRHFAVVGENLSPGPHRVRIELLAEKNTHSKGHEFHLLGVGGMGVETSAAAGQP
jgi:lysophospholipase L1-like esterase